MFEELDDLLSQNVTEDSWYDDGYLIAQDILNDFSKAEWKHLNEVILSKNIEWQKKIVYCLDNQLIEGKRLVSGWISIFARYLHN